MVSWPRLMVEATCAPIWGGLEGTGVPLQTVATTPPLSPLCRRSVSVYPGLAGIGGHTIAATSPWVLRGRGSSHWQVEPIPFLPP